VNQRRTSKSRLIIVIAAALAVAYCLLLIPAPSSPPMLPGSSSPFIWDKDAYWTQLEAMYLRARETDSTALAASVAAGLKKAEALLDSCRTINVAPSSPLLRQLEQAIFELSPAIAAQPDHLREFVQFRSRLRTTIKDMSRHWDITSTDSRDHLYRLLYGSRIAIEEIMLQAETDSVPALVVATNEPSATPSAEILGVSIHSGDILLSRGGAPTSALIARGNDYPGNFSHVALVHVDPNDGTVSIIESHIEIGVAVASVDDYLRDTKLRILVLRMRADHPALTTDPMLPHKAATYALKRAQHEHIPYDFPMDFRDNSKLFCSEVASGAYSKFGVQLWTSLSNISSVGVRSWLAAFGVIHFETQEPSDLEYDPQLRVVAEWHDPETLYKDHLDNAVIDVMLERAEAGQRLQYDWYMLPVARLAKLYSLFKNLWGDAGPIPEGMTATAALKNDRFSREHSRLKEHLIRLAEDFRLEKGYRPPYWELVKLARRGTGIR